MRTSKPTPAAMAATSASFSITREPVRNTITNLGLLSSCSWCW
uniref:Uncharacterized protein n=1 Tax=Arundo donax TaxID=35708 RepID=A0A0A9Q551_ARUDO